jgi:ribose/xylose/arabinose/galactoside ABC-type transport system permease subunit
MKVVRWLLIGLLVVFGLVSTVFFFLAIPRSWILPLIVVLLLVAALLDAPRRRSKREAHRV